MTQRTSSVQPAFRKDGPEEVGLDDSDCFHPSAVSEAPSNTSSFGFSLDGTITLIGLTVGWLWLMRDLTGYDFKVSL